MRRRDLLALALSLASAADCSSKSSDLDSTGQDPGAGGASGAGASGGSAAGGASGAAGVSGMEGAAARGPEGPSCDGGLILANGRSACENVTVSGGHLDDYIGIAVTPAPSTDVATFGLDTFPATVARFRRFRQAFDGWARPSPGDGANPAVPGTGWSAEWDGELPQTGAQLAERVIACPGSTYTDDPGVDDERPMNCLTWYEALAFCIWDGGRLPQGAEWLYAKRGGEELRPYPWGSEPPDATRAGVNCAYDVPKSCDPAGIPDVGTFPAGAARWGHMDMSGSVPAWAYDTYPCYLPSHVACPKPECACLDPSPDANGGRSTEGGGSLQSPKSLLWDGGAFVAPDFRSVATGVRCARNP